MIGLGALAIVEREASVDSAAQLVIMGALADALEARSKWDEAGQMMRRAVLVAERAYSAAHSWTASAITDLGWHEVEHGKIEAGIAELERALAMYLELESDNGEITPMLRYLGLAQIRAGDLKAARAHFDDALARCEGTPNPRCHLVRANRQSFTGTRGRKVSGVLRRRVLLKRRTLCSG